MVSPNLYKRAVIHNLIIGNLPHSHFYLLVVGTATSLDFQVENSIYNYKICILFTDPWWYIASHLSLWCKLNVHISIINTHQTWHLLVHVETATDQKQITTIKASSYWELFWLSKSNTTSQCQLVTCLLQQGGKCVTLKYHIKWPFCWLAEELEMVQIETEGKPGAWLSKWWIHVQCTVSQPVHHCR